MKISELKKLLEQYDDDDVVLVEIHEGLRYEDLYDFTIDTIDIQLKDGKTIKEVRLCI